VRSVLTLRTLQNIHILLCFFFEYNEHKYVFSLAGNTALFSKKLDFSAENRVFTADSRKRQKFESGSK
jgi:hypothetical protein